MNKQDKIYIAGHKGLVGSALARKLEKEGYKKLILKTRDELDLLDQKAVADFFSLKRPDYVFLAAAKVGGIHANSAYPAEFIYENLLIQANIIHNAYLQKVKKLLFLGSSCIYPRDCSQPMKEEYLLSGKLEPTNEPYAIAKIAGIKMCQAYNRQYDTNFISAMPTNLYGPNDNFDLEDSHVLAAMIRKFYHAVNNNHDDVELWGSGSPRREFLHVDDLADACLFLMKNYNPKDPKKIINIGTGEDITVKELAEMVKDIANFKGKISWDKSQPDGTPRKLLDVSKINKLGWKYNINLKDGIKNTFEWYSSFVRK